MDASLQARRLRVLGMQQWEEESAIQGVRTLIEACRVDPGNFLTLQILMSYSGELETMAPDDAEVRELLAAIDGLPLPSIAPPGTTRDRMAGIIKMDLAEAMAQKQWYSAGVYLSQARELSPEDPQLAQAAEVLAGQATRPAEDAGQGTQDR